MLTGKRERGIFLAGLIFFVLTFTMKALGASESRPPEKEPFLFLAVSENNLRQIQDLLKADHDPNEEMANGITPLHLAIRKCHLKAAEMLIKKGAELNAVDSTGVTPMDEAVISNNEKAKKFLELWAKHKKVPIKSRFNESEKDSRPASYGSANFLNIPSKNPVFFVMSVLKKITPKEILLQKVSLDIGSRSKAPSFQIDGITATGDQIFDYLERLKQNKYFEKAQIETTQEIEGESDSICLIFRIVGNFDGRILGILGKDKIRIFPDSLGRPAHE